MVKVLLEAGADPSQAAVHGITPIGIAELHGHKACVRLLEVSSSSTCDDSEGWRAVPLWYSMMMMTLMMVLYDDDDADDGLV